MHPAFPRFAKLTLDDKDYYLSLIEEFTPFSDISFTTLHVWWNLDDRLFFSILNDNLVLNYSQPFDGQGSGLCLIGEDMIDQSIEEIFNFQLQRSNPLRLVHVPEFVVNKIMNKANLKIEEEADMHEYIMDSELIAKLDNSDLGRIRRKVKRFLREVEDSQLEVKPLDLGEHHNQSMIYQKILDWQKKYPKANDPHSTENKAIKASLTHHRALDIHNLCLFINGELRGIALFHQSHDKKYYIVNHLKVDYQTPFIFDYLTNQIAQMALDHHVPFLNMEMDLGIEGLKNHKMGLRPVDFFKKYTITKVASWTTS